MKPVMNLDDVTFDDVEENGVYTSSRGQISGHIGARDLGYNLTVLPPGKVQCPFHNHHAEEEMFLILEGEGELRFGDQRYPICKHDVIACPPGGPTSPTRSSTPAQPQCAIWHFQPVSRSMCANIPIHRNSWRVRENVVSGVFAKSFAPRTPSTTTTASVAESPALFELAVFVAPAVEPDIRRAAITRRLTGDAPAYTRQGATARLRDLFTAFHATGCAFTRRHMRARSQHAIRYGVIDLVLNRPVPRPTARHRCYPVSLSSEAIKIGDRSARSNEHTFS